MEAPRSRVGIKGMRFGDVGRRMAEMGPGLLVEPVGVGRWDGNVNEVAHGGMRVFVRPAGTGGLPRLAPNLR